MDTFGDKLRSVRQSRELTIESASAATGVEVDRLRALEANEFDSLPGEELILASLRAYADYLSVDADLMIEDYRYERDRQADTAVPDARADDGPEDLEADETPSPSPLEEEALASAPARAESEPEPTGSLDEPDRSAPTVPAETPSRFPRWASGAGIVAVAILAAWWFRSNAPEERPPRTFRPIVKTEPTVEAPKTAAPAAAIDRAFNGPDGTGARRAPRSAEATQPDRMPRPETTTRPADTAGPIIRDYGVGSGVENRRLIGERRRFGEGTQVWFWTRVEGAASGARIHHVWLHEGVETARVKLRIGGPSWRTYSTKMLWPGSTGNWAVEARDDAGRVLAREEFACTP